MMPDFMQGMKLGIEFIIILNPRQLVNEHPLNSFRGY